MASGALPANGTLLKASDMAGSPTFTTIAEVRDLNGPTTSVNTEDVTSLDSGNYIEEVPVMIQPGEVTFDLIYRSHATHDLLWADLTNLYTRNYKMVIPTAAPQTLDFAAYPTRFERKTSQGSVLKASVTLKITGAVSKS